MSTTTSKTQPALVGGLVMGLLSVLPFVWVGNLCCCLWVVSGGLVASYLLQQNQAAPIEVGDGALVGFLAGMSGAIIYVVLAIPISILMAPFERAMVQRVFENTRNMPPEFDELMGRVGRGLLLVMGFIFMLCAGAVFSTLGGILGVALFKKRPPAGPIDIPVSP